MDQIGFLVYLNKCVGCKACEIACKNRQHLAVPGPRPRRVQITDQSDQPLSVLHALRRSRLRGELPGGGPLQGRERWLGEGGRQPLHRLQDLQPGVPLRRAPVPRRGGHDGEVRPVRRPSPNGSGSRLRADVLQQRPQSGAAGIAAAGSLRAY